MAFLAKKKEVIPPFSESAYLDSVFLWPDDTLVKVVGGVRNRQLIF
jgi:hypothetical protein